MPGPDLDLEKPSAIGGLDKLVTNFAISTIAVIPTFWTCVVMPWRLIPLLEREDPDGRSGMLLSPGAYFPLSLMVSLIAAALLSTPDTLSNNGAYLGPGLAVAVQTAASEGDIWKIVATVMPIYGFAVLVGMVGALLKPWAHQGWTLKISLRIAFYVIATLVSWMLLLTAIFDLVRVATGSYEILSLLYSIFILPTLGAVIWMYFWFFYAGGAISRIRSGALSLAVIALVFAFILGLGFLLRLQNA